jgi:ATP-dependent helicase/nuclease subunit B
VVPGQDRHDFYDTVPLEPFIAEGYLLLTPNLRLTRRIVSAWDARQAAAGGRVWQPLPVRALEQWLAEQWQLALARRLVPALVSLGVGQALELWRQVIAGVEQESGRYHLMQPAAAASLANQARELLIRWRVDLGDAATRQEFELSPDCARWLQWHDRFNERLAGAGLTTIADTQAMLLPCAGQLPPARVVLLEFGEIPPLHDACLRGLCGAIEVPQARPPTAVCRASAFDDRRAELAYVARWARRITQEEPGATVGIVLQEMERDRAPLEYLLRREFDCLGKAYGSLPVNFSAGITLDRAPVARDALRILRMGQPTVTRAAVLALLNSRFADFPDAGTPLAVKFISQLYEGGREVISVAELRRAAGEVALGELRGLALARHLTALSRRREQRRRAPPSVCAVLDDWGWPGPGPLDSLEYQQVELWYRTLEECAAFDQICAPLELEGALQLLGRCLGMQVSQPMSADSSVQVLGHLEAAGLRFDYLWLCGMQGGSWPAPARPNPFISVSLQRRRQMPHASAEREWAYTEGVMPQYRRCAGTLLGSYSRQRDGVPELPSALLQDFEWGESEVGVTATPQWLAGWQGGETERIEDAGAPPPEAGNWPVSAAAAGYWRTSPTVRSAPSPDTVCTCARCLRPSSPSPLCSGGRCCTRRSTGCGTNWRRAPRWRRSTPPRRRSSPVAPPRLCRTSPPGAGGGGLPAVHRQCPGGGGARRAAVQDRRPRGGAAGAAALCRGQSGTPCPMPFSGHYRGSGAALAQAPRPSAHTGGAVAQEHHREGEFSRR